MTINTSKYLKQKLTLLLFSWIIISCENEYPKNILTQDELVDVLVDLHLVDAAGKQQVIANNRNTLIKHKQLKGVLELHKIEKSKFDSTIQYYFKHTKKFAQVYQKVETTLTRNAEDFNQQPSEKP